MKIQDFKALSFDAVPEITVMHLHIMPFFALYFHSFKKSLKLFVKMPNLQLNPTHILKEAKDGFVE